MDNFTNNLDLIISGTKSKIKELDNESDIKNIMFYYLHPNRNDNNLFLDLSSFIINDKYSENDLKNIKIRKDFSISLSKIILNYLV